MQPVFNALCRPIVKGKRLTDITIAASYELKPARYPDKTGHDLLRDIIKGALKTWPIGPKDIDGLLVSPTGQAGGGSIDCYIHEKLISELGIQPTFAETLSLGGATFATMVDRAARAIAEGRANAVLCIASGKFAKISEGGGEVAKIISEPDLEAPYGTFIPALYGMIISEFIAKRGITKADMARVAVAQRKWALMHPDAKMYGKGELTIDDVLNSRPIAYPFNFYDCSIPCEGGGAVLVTRGDLGRKWAKQPAYILGFGEAHPRGTMSTPGSLIETGAVATGAAAFAQAGMSPADIQVAQLYDAFSATPLLLLENIGFVDAGGSGEFVRSGAMDPGGVMPTNTYGGLLSYGHTGDSSGMSVLIEGVRQVMGEAGERQVAKADRSLIHCYGGMMFDHATLILGRES